MRVEIIDARPQTPSRVHVDVNEGATVEQVLRASGLEAALREPLRLGVFGRLRSLGDALVDGDRLELYRPLLADPKAARRRRAAQKLRGGARPG